MIMKLSGKIGKLGVAATVMVMAIVGGTMANGADNTNTKTERKKDVKTGHTHTPEGEEVPVLTNISVTATVYSSVNYVSMNVTLITATGQGRVSPLSFLVRADISQPECRPVADWESGVGYAEITIDATTTDIAVLDNATAKASSWGVAATTTCPCVL